MMITGAFSEGREGRPIEEGFFDGHGLPADGTAAVFPMVPIEESRPWTPIGTGFFISNNGLFATAKHVVLDERDRLIPSLAGIQWLRRENRVIVREAIKIVTHPRADVAIGFLVDQPFAEGGPQTLNKCFCLTRAIPELGSKVATFAFPTSELSIEHEGFTLVLTTAAIAGTVEAHHPDGRDSVMLPGHCFQTSMDLRAGASGGPVAFGDGCVFGINSTGMDGMPVGFISSIHDVLDLPVPRIRLPSGEIRDSVTVAELVDLGLVPVR